MASGNERMNKSKRTDVELKMNEIIRRYSTGECMSSIAKSFDCDFGVIKRILVENKTDLKPLGFYEKGKISGRRLITNENEVIDMYKKDVTGIEIARHFNCHFSTIYDILKRNNIETKGAKHFLKGRESKRKGKTFEEIYGLAKAREIKEKVRCGTIEVMKSPEHRKILGEIRKRGYAEGRIKKFLGEEHYNWQNGKSYEPYPITFNKEFKNLVKLRDNFCCLNCGVSEQKQIVILGRKMSVHHIDYDKKNTFLQNCCSLCVSCNTLANKNREQWKLFYQEKLSKLYGYKYELLEVLN